MVDGAWCVARGDEVLTHMRMAMRKRDSMATFKVGLNPLVGERVAKDTKSGMTVAEILKGAQSFAPEKYSYALGIEGTMVPVPEGQLDSHVIEEETEIFILPKAASGLVR